MKNKKYINIILVVVLFFFFSIIGYLVPYTNDDWAWGSYIGIDRLNNFFLNYNGRYLGNLLVILLTRYRVIRALTLGFSYTSIILLSFKIVNKKSLPIFLISIILVLFMPRTLFRQVVNWTSGFTNYVPPMIFVLIWIFINKGILNDKCIILNRRRVFSMFVLGVITCLFMEHVTIYIVIASLVSLIYCYKREIKININQVTYFIGTLVGAVLMFQNGAYLNVVKGDDFYRSVPRSGIIMQSIKRYFYTVYHNLVSNNVVVLVIISVCLTYLFLKFIYKKDIKHYKLLSISLYYIVFYSMYSLIALFFPEWQTFKLVFMFIEGCLTLVYLVFLIIFILLAPLEISKKKLLFYLGSIILLVMPLFALSPITPRCFYPMYVFWCLFALELVNDTLKFFKSKMSIKVINYICIISSLVCMVRLLIISSSAFYVDNKMTSYIEKEKANNSVTMLLPKAPYEDYMKHPYPHDEENMKKFKAFYNINENVKLKFIDYLEWHDIINK